MKKNTWFRFYFESLNDPKVQSLAPGVFKLWVNALCLSGQNMGHIRNIKEFHFGLRFRTEDRAVKAMGKLVSAGLFEPNGDGWVPHNWAERQYKSDTSTERVQRFRKRSSNVTKPLHETPSEQSRSDQNRSEPPIPPKGVTGFEQFWEVYPKKKAKKDAIKAWGQLKPDTDLQEKILDAVAKQKYCAQWTRDDGQAIPYPASFIRGERWKDEVDISRTSMTVEEVEARVERGKPSYDTN